VKIWFANYNNSSPKLTIILFGRELFNRAYGFVVSNRIGMKFGGIVLQVNDGVH